MKPAAGQQATDHADQQWHSVLEWNGDLGFVLHNWDTEDFITRQESAASLACCVMCDGSTEG